MQKHEIVPLVKPLGSDVDLAPLERIADLGYKRHFFTEDLLQNSYSPRIELYAREGYQPESLAKFVPRSGFVAVYKNKSGSIDFVVLYNSPHGQTYIEHALSDCKEIEANALRQGIFSWPPKLLRKDHLTEYGFLYASTLYIAASAVALLYGMQALNDKENQRKFFEFMKEYPSTLQIGLLAYLLSFLGFASLGKWIGPGIGSMGDRIRVRKMSDKVVDYRFGEDAIRAIKKELDEANLERSIIGLFDVKRERDGAFFRQQVLELIASLNNPKKE